jgi:transcriptional regulator with XRE-family HTH domain
LKPERHKQGIHPLKAWRIGRGLTQAQAAEGAGIKQYSWSKYELGRIPARDEMQKIVAFTRDAVQPNDFYGAPAGGERSPVDAGEDEQPQRERGQHRKGGRQPAQGQAESAAHGASVARARREKVNGGSRRSGGRP